MSIFNYGKKGYWEETEHEQSFIDKLASKAAFAGMAAASLLAGGPLLSRISGKVGKWAAVRLQDGLARRRGTSPEGKTISSMFSRLLSDELVEIVEGVKTLQRATVSIKTHQARRATFMKELEDMIDPDDLETFQSARRELEEALSPLFRHRQTREALPWFFGSGPNSGISAFEQVQKKYGFRLRIPEFVKAAKRIGPDTPALRERNLGLAYAIEGMAAVKTQKATVTEGGKVLVDSLKKVVESLQRQKRAFEKVFGGRGMHEIKVGEILEGSERGEKIRAGLRKYFGKINLPGDQVDELITILEGTDENIVKLLGKGDQSGSTAEALKLFREAGTGLYVENIEKALAEGEIISLAYLSKTLRRAGQTIMNELQLPLVPFFFNAPANLLKFAKTVRPGIHYLHRLSSQGELRRMANRPGGAIGLHDEGVAIGDEIIVLTPMNREAEEAAVGARRLPGRYNLTRVRDSVWTRRAAEARKAEIKTYGQQVEDLWKSQSLVEAARKLKGGDLSERTMAESFLYEMQERFIRLGYDPAVGWTVSPRTGIAGVDQTVIEKLFGTTMGVDVSKIHPRTLMNFLEESGEDILPEHALEALEHITQAAAGRAEDMAQDLKALKNMINRGDLELLIPLDVGDREFIYSHILDLLENADNPEKAWGALTRRLGGKNILERFSELNQFSTSGFYRTLTDIAESHADDANILFQPTRRRGRSWAEKTREGMFGQEEDMTEGLLSLQEALLGEVLQGVNLGRLDMYLRGTTSMKSLEAQLGRELRPGEGLQSLTNHFVHVINDPTHPAYGEMFDPVLQAFTGDINLGELLGDLMSSHSTKRNNALALLATMYGGLEQEIASIGLSDIAQAKLINQARKDLLSFGYHTTPEAVSEKIRGIVTYNEGVRRSIEERYSWKGNWFTPSTAPEEEFFSEFLVHPTSAPSMLDWIEQPIQAMDQQIGRMFGIGELFSSLVDPNSPRGIVGTAATTLLQVPHDLGALMGVELPIQDRITALRTIGGFTLRRVLPLYAGWEIYKNLNADLHNIGAPGFDDIGANVLAHINMAGAHLKSFFRVTDILKSMEDFIPGLDMYISPRDPEEYEQYLLYEDEAVREGRGWFVGTRSHLMGGRVEHFRPNFYRRWKSHWTEAENVDIANPVYSWMPNFTNPLAPIFRILNPDWWMDKHRKDRPYPTDQQLFDPGTVLGAVFNPIGIVLGFGDDFDAHPRFWYPGAPHGYYTANIFPGNKGDLGVSSYGGGLPASMRSDFPGVGVWPGSGPDLAVPRDNVRGGGAGRGGGSGFGGGGGGFGGGGGEPLYLHFNKIMYGDDLERPGVWNSFANFIEAARGQMGLYGGYLRLMPWMPETTGTYDVQDPTVATSTSRMMWAREWGEASGPIGEFFRRFISEPLQDYDAYNPLPNTMPSWMPERFQRGDPYMRVPGLGELQLPGDAWERTHPWSRPLRARGSMIGLTEEEMVQKWLYPMTPLEGESAEDIVEFGSEVHRLAQRQLDQLGMLVGAEVAIYDEENNISGTVDAVVNTPNGMEIVEIKSQGGDHWGEVPEKYVDQLMFYMATMGIPKGSLAFVNRDNPQQARVERYEFDPERWQNILKRIKNARNRVEALVAQGRISPFEAYDIVSRFEILATVAPMSREFQNMKNYLLSTGAYSGLSVFEKKRVEYALSKADALKRSYNTYPKRFGVPIETRTARVLGVNDRGTVVTDIGSFTFAGVKFDPAAFAGETPEEVFAKFGIIVGEEVPITLIRGQFNEEVLAETTMPAIIGRGAGINRELVDSTYAEHNREDRSPLSARAIRGDSIIGRFTQWLTHSDNMLTNKLLRVRTALEQFERGEVYGTDRTNWDDPMNNYIVPIANSFTAKDPVSASIQSAVAASLFFRTKKAKARVAAGAALAGAVASLVRTAWETVTGDPWTPGRYDHQNEFDQYWDILKYLKMTGIAEKAKAIESRRSGINIDLLMRSEKRVHIENLSPWAALAIQAEKQAKRTMYGFDAATGSLADALAAIPRRQRQIAEEIIMYGDPSEKDRFYSLLGDPQKRVLGKFLGVSIADLPKKPQLAEYFKARFLPDPSWEGWDAEVDIADLRTRGAGLEGTKVEKPHRMKIDKARGYTRDISIPRMDHPTARDIKLDIMKIVSGYNAVDVDFSIRPSSRNIVNINLGLQADETKELYQAMQSEL